MRMEVWLGIELGIGTLFGAVTHLRRGPVAIEHVVRWVNLNGFGKKVDRFLKVSELEGVVALGLRPRKGKTR